MSASCDKPAAVVMTGKLLSKGLRPGKGLISRTNGVPSARSRTSVREKSRQPSARGARRAAPPPAAAAGAPRRGGGGGGRGRLEAGRAVQRRGQAPRGVALEFLDPPRIEELAGGPAGAEVDLQDGERLLAQHPAG